MHRYRIDEFRSDVIRYLDANLKIDKTSTRTFTFRHLISTSNEPIAIPSVLDLLQAFTLPNAGEEFDMERLEILGDVFLKYAVGIQEFCRSTSDMSVKEGLLTQNRSRIVGNRNLFQVAIKHNFPTIINARKLEPHINFMAPRLQQKVGLEEAICKMDEEFSKITCMSILEYIDQNDILRLSDENMSDEIQKELISLAKKRSETGSPVKGRNARFNLRQHVRIGDKYLADVVESVIGSFLQTSGQNGALGVMKYLGLDEKGIFEIESFPRNSFLSCCYEEGDVKDIARRKQESLQSKIDIPRVEDVLGYKFQEKTFLLQALTHASFIGNTITPSYERLEYLGDGILDYLITCYIYSHDDKKVRTPGDITELRSALVENNVSWIS